MSTTAATPRALIEFLDIIILICDYLFPYDVLSLSNTCRSMRTLLFSNKSVWLQVANNSSHLHPLPFTHISTSDITVEIIRQASLRSQRVSRKWKNDVVVPSETTSPKKFSYSDRRSISYLAFLPGGRHLLIIDTKYNISCWSNEGRCLAEWNCPSPAELARWKPMEADKTGMSGIQTHLIEIMLHQEREDDATFYAEIISLHYTPSTAEFRSKSYVFVPDVYWPMRYSFMQEDLYGVLVTVDQGRWGLYLYSGKLDKAICLDIGEECDRIVQVLTSPQHIVLYWEVEEGAQALTYDTPELLQLIRKQGYKQKSTGLENPIYMPPANSHFISFKTILKNPILEQEGMFEDVEVEMDRSPGVYPVIIPKWATLYEKYTDHRVRSIMSLSRRRNRDVMEVSDDTLSDNMSILYDFILHTPPNELDANGEVLIQEPEDLGIDAPLHHHHHHHHFHNHHHHLHPVGDNNEGDVEIVDLIEPSFDSLPYTTITHHYWDYNRRPEQMTRTVLGNVRLRRLPTPGLELDDGAGDIYDELPIMGYGGRCALWVEEVDPVDDAEIKGVPNLVMKLVTFPAYVDQPDAVQEYPASDIPASIPKVSTVTLPPEIDINEAVSLDLDDALGLIAIATKKGDMYVVDYS